LARKASGKGRKGRKNKRRWLSTRGRSLEITKSGWLFIGLSLLVGFAAINSGSNLLHAIFGAMLALIIASGVLSEATVRRVRARRVVPGPLHAQTAAPLVVDVTGTDAGDVLAVSVEDQEDSEARDGPAPGRCTPAFAVRVPGKQTISLSASVTMPRRGPATLPRAEVVTRFPFGLFIKRRVLPEPGRVLVYPRLHAVSEAALGLSMGGEEQGEQERSRAGEFFGLREYREGDDPRRIHWAAVARLAGSASELVVREMETGGVPEQAVELPSGVPGEPAFEDAIERAASVAIALLDRGAPVCLRAGARLVVPTGRGAAHRRHLLDAFAMAGFEDSDRPVAAPAAASNDAPNRKASAG